MLALEATYTSTPRTHGAKTNTTPTVQGSRPKEAGARTKELVEQEELSFSTRVLRNLILASSLTHKEDEVVVLPERSTRHCAEMLLQAQRTGQHMMLFSSITKEPRPTSSPTLPPRREVQ